MPQTTISSFFSNSGAPRRPPPTSSLAEDDGQSTASEPERDTEPDTQASAITVSSTDSLDTSSKNPRKSGHKYHNSHHPYNRSTGPSQTTRYPTQPMSASQKKASRPYRRNNGLADVAQETLSVLPGLLSELPHLNCEDAEEFRLTNLAPLDSASNPRYVPPGGAAPRTAIRVVNADTFDAALDMVSRIAAEDSSTQASQSQTQSQSQSQPPQQQQQRHYGLPAVLNFASNLHPGGGWLNGARAQEEALCYRSSLFQSINQQRFYPIRQLNGLYTPHCVIIRSSMDAGHALLVPDTVADPKDLPVVSVISVAALRRPPLRTVPDAVLGTRKVFQRAQDRELTKAKMRLSLRIGATKGHGLLVLGALGCGAFLNPPEEVAACWAEVLREDEFIGGRFREVLFAVWDKKGEGNFGVFEGALDGLML